MWRRLPTPFSSVYDDFCFPSEDFAAYRTSKMKPKPSFPTVIPVCTGEDEGGGLAAALRREGTPSGGPEAEERGGALTGRGSGGGHCQTG